MANGIYKATLKMRWLGQAIVNTLWYRSVLEGTFGSDLLIDGARALGKSVIEHVWAAHWRQYAPTDLYFDGVSVMGYNDQFELLYNNTITVVPASGIHTGSISASEAWLPIANCANIAFSLKNRLISNPLYSPPHKGLIAVTPIDQSWAGNDGTLSDAGMVPFNSIAAGVSEKLPWDYVDIDLPFTGWTINAGVPDVFIPIRAKTWQWDLPREIGGFTVFKHIETCDVESAAPRKLLGYRRSRRVES